MRIAYLTGEYPRATDTFVQREVAHLRKLGVEVTTIAIRRPGSEHLVGEEQRVESQRTQYVLPTGPFKLIKAHVSAFTSSPSRYIESAKIAWKTRGPGIRRHIYQLFYFAEAAIVSQILKQNKIDRLHNHFANSSCSVSMLAATMAGTPYSFTIHGPAIFYEPMLWRIDEKIARADFVACISHFCRSQGMVFAKHEHWHKMRIVHCGVDPSTYGHRQHKSRAKQLIYVGRLAAVKGLGVLLEAMTTIDSSVTLTVVGDGPDRKMLEADAAGLGLADRVSFVGYQSQQSVRELLAASDIFVMSSFAEGVPVVLMEAMANALPVVATRIAGVGELVDETVNGYLVPPGDDKTLAQRINQLVDNADLRQSMGDHGREKVARCYNLEREAAWLKSIFTGEADASLRPAWDHQESPTKENHAQQA